MPDPESCLILTVISRRSRRNCPVQMILTKTFPNCLIGRFRWGTTLLMGQRASTSVRNKLASA